uniref:Ubiquitin-like protease family profile domain-containing protein n=1 Tax=Brassica oleracea var. oleracea TaxID=109376 RepID=A0A0D3AAA5_BRAOL
MLGFQLDIKKKYELWGLVGPKPVRFLLLEFENLTCLNCEYIEDFERPHCVVTKELISFWEMLGVHVEAEPSTQGIIAAFERCEGWSRDDRKRLAYFAIFTGYIEERIYSTPTRVSLARLVMELEPFENYPWGRVVFKVMMDSVKGEIFRVWVNTALPELGANYGNPLPNNPSPPILAYKGRKRRIQFKEAILSQVWGTDIDDVYAPVNYNDTHWIAMWILIPKRHIVVWNSICSSISPQDLDVVMEPFLYMVPYLLVECASSDEQRAQYSLELFTYERLTNIPPVRAGDCGVYTLKYIECHALGIKFSKKYFA